MLLNASATGCLVTWPFTPSRNFGADIRASNLRSRALTWLARPPAHLHALHCQPGRERTPLLQQPACYGHHPHPVSFHWWARHLHTPPPCAMPVAFVSLPGAHGPLSVAVSSPRGAGPVSPASAAGGVPAPPASGAGHGHAQGFQPVYRQAAHSHCRAGRPPLHGRRVWAQGVHPDPL